MKKNAGLTLIEIMVVVVIIGIIAGVVAANVGDKPDKAKWKLTGVLIKQLKADVEMYKADNNIYPETLEDLVPRYLEAVPKDLWGNSFLYRKPGTRGPFEIVSWGADGRPGGEGYDADLSSHPVTK